MPKMTQKISVIAVALAAALLFTGCSEDKVSTTADPTDPIETSSTGETTSPIETTFGTETTFDDPNGDDLPSKEEVVEGMIKGTAINYEKDMNTPMPEAALEDLRPGITCLVDEGYDSFSPELLRVMASGDPEAIENSVSAEDESVLMEAAAACEEEF